MLKFLIFIMIFGMTNQTKPQKPNLLFYENMFSFYYSSNTCWKFFLNYSPPENFSILIDGNLYK